MNAMSAADAVEAIDAALEQVRPRWHCVLNPPHPRSLLFISHVKHQQASGLACRTWSLMHMWSESSSSEQQQLLLALPAFLAFCPGYLPLTHATVCCWHSLAYS